jgi:hypothetical protein
MRSFSDVNLLTVILLALVVGALLNLYSAYGIAEWGYEVGLRLLRDVVGFI